MPPPCLVHAEGLLASLRDSPAEPAGGQPVQQYCIQPGKEQVPAYYVDERLRTRREIMDEATRRAEREQAYPQPVFHQIPRNVQHVCEDYQRVHLPPPGKEIPRRQSTQWRYRKDFRNESECNR